MKMENGNKIRFNVLKRTVVGELYVDSEYGQLIEVHGKKLYLTRDYIDEGYKVTDPVSGHNITFSGKVCWKRKSDLIKSITKKVEESNGWDKFDQKRDEEIKETQKT